jgi:hypothetical protein
LNLLNYDFLQPTGEWHFLSTDQTPNIPTKPQFNLQIPSNGIKWSRRQTIKIFLQLTFDSDRWLNGSCSSATDWFWPLSCSILSCRALITENENEKNIVLTIYHI